MEGYDRRAMAERSPLRYFAPLALLVAVIGVVLVVQGARIDVSSSSDPAGSVATQRAQSRKRIYVVRPGDSFSQIAARVHVSLVDLESLNPRIDPQAIRAGQRIKLRR
jgi:LysM repeat protein